MAQEAWVRKLMQKSGGINWGEQSDFRKVRIFVAGALACQGGQYLWRWGWGIISL